MTYRSWVGALALASFACAAQDPMYQVVNDSPPETSSGSLVVVVLIAYAVCIWAVLGGPLKEWGNENRGLGWAFMAFVPGIIGLVWSLWGPYL